MSWKYLYELVATGHNLEAFKRRSLTMTLYVLNRGRRNNMYLEYGRCVMGGKTISKGLQLFTLIDVKSLGNVRSWIHASNSQQRIVKYAISVVLVAKYQNKVELFTKLIIMWEKVRQILGWSPDLRPQEEVRLHRSDPTCPPDCGCVKQMSPGGVSEAKHLKPAVLQQPDIQFHLKLFCQHSCGLHASSKTYLQLIYDQCGNGNFVAALVLITAPSPPFHLYSVSVLPE